MDPMDFHGVRSAHFAFAPVTLTGFERRVAGCYSVVFAFTMRETRAPVLQAKMIKRKAKEAQAKGDLQLPTAAVPKSSFKELLWISCTRPLSTYPQLRQNFIVSDADLLM